jgi:uncharacterized membrane protein
LGTNIFVYLFGRGFMGTVFSLFAASVLASAGASRCRGSTTSCRTWPAGSWPGAMAWSPACCSVFVAFRPHWLATWSDRLYLYEQVAEKHDRSA